MPLIQIDTTCPAQVRRFVRFPFILYHGCAQWVPPLLREARRALDRERYPFYRESDAAFFIYENGSEVLGRIAAIENRPYNAFHDTRTAFFYYLDMINDRQISRALFDGAFDWARARGLDTIYGPTGLLRGDGRGLLVDGFEHRPAFGIAYNYPYYGELVEDAGFAKSHDYLSGYLARSHVLPPRLFKVADKVRTRRGLWVKTFQRRRELLALAPALHRIYESAFRQVWGYYPVGQDEIEALVRRILLVADPRLIKFVLKKEEPIGFVIGYPDISAALQRTKGRLWPLGWLELVQEARRTSWVNFNGLGVLPDYQGLGANTVLYAELARTFEHDAFCFEHADLVQVAENNRHSLGDMNALQARWYKRHRIYRRTL